MPVCPVARRPHRLGAIQSTSNFQRLPPSCRNNSRWRSCGFATTFADAHAVATSRWCCRAGQPLYVTLGRRPAKLSGRPRRKSCSPEPIVIFRAMASKIIGRRGDGSFHPAARCRSPGCLPRARRPTRRCKGSTRRCRKPPERFCGRRSIQYGDHFFRSVADQANGRFGDIRVGGSIGDNHHAARRRHGEFY